MSEIMRAIPFENLVNWIFSEYNSQGSVFGIKKEKFYKNKSGTKLNIFGDSISSMVGPAAGPNSQLTQNIVASYLTGARFMELKTVQIIDGEDLRKAVARPCINAEDECYNVEWSTEFTVQEAFDEYVKAWFLLHLLMRKFNISEKRDFVFNMSVGYDLEGIKSPKVDNFIEGMKNASETKIWQECVKFLNTNLDKFENFNKNDLDNISSSVSPSITLSTLHGCPPQEIERIANYLLTEKKIHTYIKCNPTLLGYDYARKTMDDMGYSYVDFDDHHFNNDLQLKDALPMLERLRTTAEAEGKEFGVKITNTFPVQNDGKKLPGQEMYMSGRSLYPLSVSVAKILSENFSGKLPISYSGGADYFNIKELAKLGIRPITVATTILKPGGYNRFKQLAEETEKTLGENFTEINVIGLQKLVENITKKDRHKKDARLSANVKTNSTLPLFDCFKAPCKEGGCPIQQQIPEYVNLVDAGKPDEAFKIIAIDNALPSVTGTICDHNCQNKCTRNDYDEPVEIRRKKLAASEKSQMNFINSMKPSEIKTNKKAVVIGAGPAGIAISLFLRRNGMDVSVFEKNAEPFGIVKYIIPEFRISESSLKRDYEMAKAAGVNFFFNAEPNYDLKKLKNEYDFVVLATGAWKEGACPVKEGGENIIDALKFLADSKKNNCKVNLGKKIAVIGAGDVAMDCARAATRAEGAEEVTIVYRRTREFMPALNEEINLALADGVKICELYAPVFYDGKTLTCEIQELTNEYDSSGRKKIKGTGKQEVFEFDTVIGAVGARVDTSLFEKNEILLNKWGMPKVNSSNESSIQNVYIAGDCKAGASTVVKAIADAKIIAKNILEKSGLSHDFVRIENPVAAKEIYNRKGILTDTAEANRCLSCDQICEICTEVCPNRANVSIIINSNNFKNNHQILHIDGMCNECGNCGTFCPHSGNPYKNKITLFWTEEDFADSTNTGFIKTGENEYKVRLENGETKNYKSGDIGVIPSEIAEIISTIENDYPHYITN